MKPLILLKKRLTKLKYFKLVLSLLIIGIITGVIFGIYYYKNKPICEKCNVILVSLDTLSALHLPCYGYERNTAPNLCAYADKNILFLNSYSQTPATLQSQFSIFTSLYTNTHKIKGFVGEKLDEKYLTLAQIFRLNGYQTIYHGPLQAPSLPLSRGIGRGFNVVEGPRWDDALKTWPQAYSKLLENSKQKKASFLFLHTYNLHYPIFPGHKQKHLFTNLPEYPNIPLTEDEYANITSPDFVPFVVNLILDENYELIKYEQMNSDRKIAKELMRAQTTKESRNIFLSLSPRAQGYAINKWYYSKIDKNDPKQIEYLKALYDEQIFNLDKKLADLFKLMDDPILSKNTILIITSDHGEEFMEHGNLYHISDLYRTQTQVPLIIHIPGVSPKKIKELVQGIDIYPTALGLTGLSPKSAIQGIDLTGLILGKKNAKTNKYLRSEWGSITAIQYENWRLYYDKKNKIKKELYNLTKDPNEEKNVISLYSDKADEIIKLVGL